VPDEQNTAANIALKITIITKVKKERQEKNITPTNCSMLKKHFFENKNNISN